jgi:hypothetical protein
MKEERLWADIGPEKTNLLKLYGFEIVGGESRPRHAIGNTSLQAIFR